MVITYSELIFELSSQATHLLGLFQNSFFFFFLLQFLLLFSLFLLFLLTFLLLPPLLVLFAQLSMCPFTNYSQTLQNSLTALSRIPPWPNRSGHFLFSFSFGSLNLFLYLRFLNLILLIFDQAMWQCLGMQDLNPQSRDRTPTPSSLHWELGVLTTELPGKSHGIFFFLHNFCTNILYPKNQVIKRV